VFVDIARAVLLGVLQGLTEFLPVSSSGHLVIGEHLLGVKQPGVLFEVVVHCGTLAAVFVAYSEDIYKMIISFGVGLRDLAGGRIAWRTFLSNPYVRLAGLLVLGTVPVVIIVPLAHDYLTGLFTAVRSAAGLLIVTGLVLLVAELYGRGRRDMPRMTGGDALMVGLAQVAAVAPGLSRSGLTISAGLLLGLQRETAARFSFLLSIPAVLGAVLLELPDASLEGWDWRVLFAGAAAAAIAGYLAIRLLLTSLRRGSLAVYTVYCWTIALATFAYLWFCSLG